MNSTQRNKLAMYAAVIAVCKDYNSSWEGLPAFVTVFESFEKAISDIKDNVEVQQLTTTGITRQKEVLKANMVGTTIEIGGALASFANANGNNGLRDQVVFSQSELNRVPDGVCAEQCRLVLGFAKQYLDQTADYGLVADKVDAFEQDILAYEAELGKTRRIIIQKKTATQKLKALFDAADAMLSEHLDRLIEQFQEDAPAYYNEYHNARFIINVRGPGRPEGNEDGNTDDVAGDSTFDKA